MKYTQHSPDNELINGCLQQHRLAQKYLYQRYYGKMLGICMRYTRHPEEATDVLNRAFFKVFKSEKIPFLSFYHGDSFYSLWCNFKSN